MDARQASNALSNFRVRMDHRGVCFGVTKHGLADRSVLHRFVRSRTRAAMKAVPTKMLAFGNQTQLNSGWFDEFGIKPVERCAPGRRVSIV